MNKPLYVAIDGVVVSHEVILVSGENSYLDILDSANNPLIINDDSVGSIFFESFEEAQEGRIKRIGELIIRLEDERTSLEEQNEVVKGSLFIDQKEKKESMVTPL